MEATKSLSVAMEVIMKPPVYFFIVAIIIVKLLLLKYIPTHVLVIYRNIWFRIGFAVLVALFAAYDYILATLLVACYVLAIQELNNRDAHAAGSTAASTASTSTSVMDSILGMFGISTSNATIPELVATPVPTMEVISRAATLVQPLQEKSNLVNLANVDNVNYTLQHTQAVDLVNVVNSSVDQDNLVPKMDMLAEIGNTDPAFATLTENLMAKGFENLSLDQLKLSASNLVAGVDPDKPVGSSNELLNAQGLNFPTGFDKCSTMTSKC